MHDNNSACINAATDTMIGPQNVTTNSAIDRVTMELIIDRVVVDHVIGRDVVQKSAVVHANAIAPTTCPNIATRAALAADHVTAIAFMNQYHLEHGNQRRITCRNNLCRSKKVKVSPRRLLRDLSANPRV